VDLQISVRNDAATELVRVPHRIDW
jgi:hypothetical protein